MIGALNETLPNLIISYTIPFLGGKKKTHRESERLTQYPNIIDPDRILKWTYPKMKEKQHNFIFFKLFISYVDIYYVELCKYILKTLPHLKHILKIAPQNKFSDCKFYSILFFFT